MRLLLATLCVLLASTAVIAAKIEGHWNASRLESLADASIAEGDPDRARALLRQATAANPRQISAWLDLGLQAEQAGDLQEAEAALKEAARLDRQYLPAWTLANFYFRRADHEDFWLWARRAAHMTYDDFRPLFRLCDAFEPDAEAVMNRLGNEKDMLRAYVTYLAGEGHRLDAAERAAWRLADVQDARDQPIFVNLITREIAANRMLPAVALWNARFLPLDPQHGSVGTNGDFGGRPTGEAFDWSMPSCPGLVSEWQPGRVAFNLNGHQPDECILLEQPIPVASRRRYRLRIEGTGQPAGIVWEVAAQAVASGGIFRSPGDALVRLRLVSRRAPGSLAFEGRIEIRNVRIEVE